MGKVTLHDCLYTQTKISNHGQKAILFVHLAISGHHIEEDKYSFNEIRFSVESLSAWLGDVNQVMDKIFTKKEPISFNGPLYKFVCNYENVAISLIFTDTISQNNEVVGFEYSQNVQFHLKSDKPKNLTQYIRVINMLIRFVCFVTDSSVSVFDISGYRNDLYHEFNGKKIPEKLCIYYGSTTHNSERKKVNRSNSLFSYNSVESRLGDLISKWLDVCEKFSSSINLYFAAKLSDSYLLDDKFVFQIQALEAYHRDSTNKKYMDEAKFQLLVKQIVDSCPADYRDWLMNSLKYRNEVALSERLKDLMMPYLSLFGNSKNRSRLIRKSVDTRNYLTHFDPKLRTKRLVGGDLYLAQIKWELLIQIILLANLGFSHDEIILKATNSHVLNYKLKG